MKALHMIAFILTIIGGINWGLVGLGGLVGGNWNVVNLILGSWPSLEGIVYVLVGLSAIYLAATHKQTCMYCKGSAMGGGAMM